MTPSLRLKSRLIGSPVEDIAGRIIMWRDMLRHPEMTDVFIEKRLLAKILAKTLRADDVVVDVGCHIGSFLNMVLCTASAGSHIGIEPSPTKALRLKHKFPQCRIEQLAISDRAGIAAFEEYIHESGFSRLKGDKGLEKPFISYDVELKRLDDLLAGETRIDLLKIDIEGSELPALRGGKATIERLKPTLIFESAGDIALAAFGTSSKEVYQFVTSDLGYSIFTFGDFLFEKGPLSLTEFMKAGLYPFKAFTFIATAI